MADLSTATLSVINFLLAASMFFFAIKAARLFGRSRAGKAWQYFILSTAILGIVSLVALGASLESLVLPTWWREGGALAFRASLAYAIYHFYRAWRTFGQ